MSESTSATPKLSPLPFIIIKIFANHICDIEAIAATYAGSLNHTTLYSSYENTINLTHALHSSKNLTDQFTMLVTENDDLILEYNTAIADLNMLTTQVMQLEAKLMQTLTLVTTTTNVMPTGYKGQTHHEEFTREDLSKLRSFVALLHLHLINYPREFPNE
jgi:hypothetical protein